MSLVQEVYQQGIRSLCQVAFNKTNQDGRDFMKTYIRNPIEEIHLTEGNWFIVITSTYAYSLPYKDSGCKPAHFGDRAYAYKTCNLKE